ncbi:PhoP/PhoQ regulator MgrB [Klebsiella pneumoniae]|uniref:PhoP/PhoQ regulator MgrB n=1 Tax=Klebsiella pneumoniae TaxID=573 RepID=UPI00187FB61B|nr:PhoP/PhoQ regulator MgrB [Klebsiella pneumoniae]
MPLRITPSVAEQEGQQTETEATGAPQKHHYTLNQQVGSITQFFSGICTINKFIPW